MPNIPVNNCCGCTACYNVCPKSAIQMLPNQEGFLYPMINAVQCCECNKCEQVCPIIHAPVLPQTYADCVVAQNQSKEVLEESTSGGFIDSLCKYILNDCHGFVAGVLYDEKFLPRHIITDSYEIAKKFRNSKYAQSEIGNIFTTIRERLLKNEQVMFIGTPCQVAGLKAFLSNDYENLITVDLICRSIPSPKLWRLYLDWQETRHNTKIKNIACRKKTYGYHSGALEIEFENGKHYAGSNRVDYYMKSFHKDICSRWSCYQCNFKTKHRCSDFTVSDSWNPHLVTDPAVKDNDCGYSNVFVHTEKGKNVLYQLKDVALYKADDEKQRSFVGGMMEKSIVLKKEREFFYADIDKYGFYQTVKRYSKVSLIDRIIEFVKPFRYALKKFFMQWHK